MSNAELWSKYWSQGLTPNEYVASLSSLVEEFTDRLDNYQPQPITEPIVVTKVAVITEDWCGDSVNYVPVIFKVCQNLPNVEIRVFKRDSFPEVRDANLYNGKAKIPVIVFLNDQFEELGRFVERPLVASRYVGTLVRSVDMSKFTEEDKQNFKKRFIAETRQFQPDAEKIFVEFLTGKKKS